MKRRNATSAPESSAVASLVANAITPKLIAASVK